MKFKGYVNIKSKKYDGNIYINLRLFILIFLILQFELFILIRRLWFIGRNDCIVGIDILLMIVKFGNDVYNLMKKKIKEKNLLIICICIL